MNKIKPNIVIIGASGHAKVIIDIIERLDKYHIIGLIDSFKPVDSYIFNYKIIGKEDDIPTLKNTFNFNKGIIAIGDNYTRKNIYKKTAKIDPGFKFISAIHPDAIIGKNVKIGKGAVVMAGVIVNSDAEIGEFCIINTKASLGHDAKMIKFSSLAPNSTIGGNVKIGTCSAICLSASVIQDINIGKHSIVGAGALVNRNIDNYQMVYGVPARVIKTISKGKKYLYQTKTFVKHHDKSKTNATLEIITDKSEWDNILKELTHYDFYHTYDYHMLSKAVHEKPILIKYVEGSTTIALPLLCRKIDGTNYKDATSVYGYPGPISKGISSDFNNANFKKTLKNYLLENNYISVFSRLNPFIPNQNMILNEIGAITNQGQVVNIDLTLDIGIQRQNFQSRLKTHINKARRCCVIKKATTENDIKQFMEIYYENMNRVNAKKSYYFDENYFVNMTKSKDFESEILLAIDNETGETIAASQYIMTNNIVQYHLSGTKDEFLHLMPTKLLIDEMRLIASKRGFTYFNLGGGLGGKDDDSLFNFKSSFSKDFKQFNLWKLICNQKVYDELVIKKGLNTISNFFPLYRSLDDININL